jgi:hypothetical protein
MDTASERARSLGYLLVGLADLADKYAALDELGAGEPGRTVSRRDAMRRVAARFPAALREFDQTSVEERRRRAQTIEDALAALVIDTERSPALSRLAQPEAAWMRAAAELHAYLRELLKVKRWLAGRMPDPSVLAELPSWYADCGDPRWPLEHWAPERLAQVAAPPRGRVTDLAYEEVAGRHGLSASALRRLLYPHNEANDVE